MKRIYPDDMQLDQFLVLNETDYKVLAYCLDEMSIHVPVNQSYNKIHISQEELEILRLNKKEFKKIYLYRTKRKKKRRDFN